MQNFYLRLAPYSLALIETLLLAGGALILLKSRSRLRTARPARIFPLGRVFVQLARRKRLAAVLTGVSVVLLRAALIPLLGVPQPRFHDEFSYLLAADTFANGRLTNPAHPQWMHFESFHILQQPTYMSMYPPAQGLVLALGQKLGSPWVGQMLVTALLCTAVCWMLQGWLPAPWALLGAAFAVLRLGILSYWMNTYWCASVAALGGAMVLGSWPRLRRRLRILDSVVMAFGLAILANSRPYEGLVFSLPVASSMLWWMAGPKRPPLRPVLQRLLLPLCAVVLCAGLATGFYYWRVTGDPFRMSYQVNRETYAAAPYFIWQHARAEPIYRHPVMRDFYLRELANFNQNRTVDGFVIRAEQKAQSWWLFYLGPLLTLPLLAFPRVIRQKKMRLPLAICAAMLLAFAIQTWTLPHYFSPAVGALYILLIQCMRHMRHWRWGELLVGPSMVRALPLLACAMILLRVTAVALHVRIEPTWPRGDLERAALLSELQRLPGPQLVIVHYGSHHDVDREWVYNRANIDTSKVVWARDMGAEANQELLRYFDGRRAWQVEADAPTPTLVPQPD
jgi:hypothetical protein